MSNPHNLDITKGKTTVVFIRWENPQFVSKPITAISTDSGFPRLTVASHGIPNGWRAYIAGVKGMAQINTKNIPPKDSDFREVTAFDANTIELNGVIPIDDSGRDWSPYISGGFVQFYSPRDLSGAAVRVKVKDRIGGKVVLSSDPADVPLNLFSVTLDNTGKKISIEFPASASANLSIKRGVWEVEAEVSGKVESLVPPSPVCVSDEVVT